MKTLFIFLQRVLPQHVLSRIVGSVANSRVRFIKNTLIRMFVAVYGVDMEEAESRDPDDYPTFNRFFTRALKDGARSIEGHISSPADGTVSMAGRIDGSRILQAKGETYSLAKLMGGKNHAQFDNGSFITIYLAPKDYHRVHTPLAGTLTTSRYIPGRLFSVNQATTERITDLFANNERLVTTLDTTLGPVGLVMVGAMIVAGIKSMWREEKYMPGRDVEEANISQQFNQGALFGHFEMGSTVILLFPDAVDFNVSAGDRVKMGQAIA